MICSFGVCSTEEGLDEAEVVTTGEDGSEQSSTAVLATLAALAEATGPLNAASTTSEFSASCSSFQCWNFAILIGPLQILQLLKP